MTSVGPYNQSYDMSHQWHFTDLRGPELKGVPQNNSFMTVLGENKQFKIFEKIVKMAGLAEDLCNSQEQYTLFVPRDDYIMDLVKNGDLCNMDRGLARQIVRYAMFPKKIDGKLLESSPVSYYTTMNNYANLYVTNISGVTYLNNCVKVIQKDINACNGVIHVTDGLINPTLL